MNKTSFWKAGHAPTLLASFFYFDLSFMVWVLLGPLAIQISADLQLTAAQKGLMVATPLLAGALLQALLDEPFLAMTVQVGCAQRLGRRELDLVPELDDPKDLFGGTLAGTAPKTADTSRGLQSIAIGDLESFKIDKLERANLFIIKPVVAGATTNLTVETQKNIYFLQVTESAKGSPNYSVKFTVPESAPLLLPEPLAMLSVTAWVA